jgi:hypothetical protein
MARSSSLWLVLALVSSACQPTPVVGASCMHPSDCRMPLACRFERCRTACTLNSDCPSGSTCLFEPAGDGWCGVTQDLRCSTVVMCDDDLACVADRCMARCRDASDCPADGVCAAAAGIVSRVCFDARSEIPDADVGD